MTAAEIAREFWAELPDEIGAAVADVRLVVMDAPTPGMVEDYGIEQGEAAAFVQLGEDAMPLSDGMTDERPRRTIYLFGENLRPATPARVREVLTHEIAHACGMDEDEVRELLP